MTNVRAKISDEKANNRKIGGADVDQRAYQKHKMKTNGPSLLKKPVPHVKLLKTTKMCQPITNPMKKPYRAKPVKLNLLKKPNKNNLALYLVMNQI